jgi:DNA-binding MarR family transcriptional regulator
MSGANPPTRRVGVENAVQTVARLYPELYLLLHRRSGAVEERLTPQSLAILQHLTFSGPLTVGEMAKHLGRAQSVVSETVHALERRGLLARVRDERDRRRSLVWLTEASEELLQRLREVLDRGRLRAAIGAMSNQDVHALVRGLEALVRAADSGRGYKEEKS